MDLLEMRQSYMRDGVMLCFNGPISRSLLEEIGNALRNYLNSQNATPSASMDIFAIYIEMSQNIRHYTRERGYVDDDAAATIVVSRKGDDRYVISAGNMIEMEDAETLVSTIESLGQMDKPELKKAYKAQLRRPRGESAPSGAGLGLLDMARKASRPLEASVTPVEQGRGFFSLTATI